jgi:Helix-hairpin-helix domain
VATASLSWWLVMPAPYLLASGSLRRANGLTTVRMANSSRPGSSRPRRPLRSIERYLASGMIRGIGPVYAKKLPRAFGEKVFDVIEAEPDRLCEVDGIGHVRASRIVTAWADPLRCAQPRGGAFGDETEGVDQCPDVGKVC